MSDGNVDRPGHERRASLERAETFIQEGGLDDALAELEQLLAEQPELPEAWLLEAIVQRQRGEPESALKAVSQFARLVPDEACDPNVVVLHANSLTDLDRSADALEYLDAVEQRQPGSQTSTGVQVARVYALAKSGAWQRVVDLAETIHTSSLEGPDRALVQFFLGRGLTELERYDEASAILSELLPQLEGKDPERSAVNLYLSVALSRLGSLQAAVEAARAAEPGQPPAGRRSVAFQRALWQRQLGDREGALEALELAASAAEEADADQKPRSNILGVRMKLLLELARFEEATRVLDEASDWIDATELAIYRAIVQAEDLVTQDRVDDAVELLARQEQDIAEPWPLRVKRCKVLLDAGRPRDALSLQHELTALADRLDRRATVLDIQVASYGRLVGELTNLEEVDEIVRAIPDDEWRPMAVAGLAVTMIQLASPLAGRFLRQQEEAGTFEADTAPAAFASGMVNASFARGDAAQEAFDRAFEIEPGFAKVPSFVFLRAVNRLFGGDPDSNVAAAKEVEAVIGPNALSTLARGSALAARGESDAAVQTLQVAMRLASGGLMGVVASSAWNKIGHVELGRKPKRLEDALAAFDQADEVAPKGGAGVLFRMGNELGRSLVYYLKNDLKQALEAGMRAVEESTSLPVQFALAGVAEWIVGYLLRALRRNDEAVVWLERAESLRPDDFEVLINSAMVRTCVRDLREGIGYYRRAADVAANDDERWEAHFGAGIALLRLGSADNALMAARVCVATGAQRARTWELLGLTYRALGCHRASLEVFRRGFELAQTGPRRASLAHGLTAAQLTLGRLTEVLQVLEPEDAAPLFEDEPRLHVNLGTAYYRLRDSRRDGRKLARREWKRAHQADPSIDVPRIEGRSEGRQGWLRYWFGDVEPRTQTAVGGTLMLLILLALALAVLSPAVLHGIRIGGAPLLSLDSWETRTLPLFVLFVLFVLPTVIKLKVGPFEFEGPTSEPEPDPLSFGEDKDVTEKMLQRLVVSATQPILPPSLGPDADMTEKMLQRPHPLTDVGTAGY